MRLKADSLDILQDRFNGGFMVSLHIDEIPSGAEKLREGPLSVNITKYRPQRSITANAYYWTIATKIRDAINTEKPDVHVTLPEVHNTLLRKYGTLEEINGDHYYVFVPDTDEAWKDILQKEIYHLKPTSKVKDGRRWYMMIKGSSDYNTKEFSLLLDGAISEAKQMGIDTVSTEEVKRMMEDYEKHFAKR